MEKNEGQTEQFDDGVDRDWLLQHLVTTANHENNFSQPITLWVAGGIISGLLVSGRKYFEEYSKEFASRFHHDDFEKMREMIIGLGKPYHEKVDKPIVNDTMFIHLLDAQFWSPSGSIPSGAGSGVTWRGRISQITGYSLGKIVRGEK